MKYQQIKFKDLPFLPGNGQVFYIESSFDSQVNGYINSHYIELCDAMRMYDMQFYYFPLLFHSAGIEQKIRYYAPYLSEKIIASKRIESNALLKFLYIKDQKIEPSLIFSARNDLAEQETTFLQLPLMEVCKDGCFCTDDIIHAIVTVNEEWLSSQIGQVFETKGILPSSNPSNTSEESASAKCKDKRRNTSGTECEDTVHIQECRRRTSANREINYNPEEIKHLLSECREIGENEQKISKRSRMLEVLMRFFESSEKDECEDSMPSYASEPAIDKEEEQSLIDTERVLRELRQNVQRLRLEGVSLMAIHEFIDKQEPLSRMVITEDYRIFLADYNNMEIEMGALPKAVYFLFLRYPEGIIYKHMPDYYNELLGIYRQLRPNTDEAKLNLTITKIVNPLGNALNENMARIRKAFVDKFDEHLASHYIISGERGSQYTIPLDRELITWEE